MRCRRAVRSILDGAPVEPRVRSVFETPTDAPSLTAPELERLRALPLPGTVVVTPDVPPRPGIPTTSATLAGAAMEADAQGRLSSFVEPGHRTLRLHHADADIDHCLRVDPCQTINLVAHGAKLAIDPHVRTGACENSLGSPTPAHPSPVAQQSTP